jgi:hypothetical protein
MAGRRNGYRMGDVVRLSEYTADRRRDRKVAVNEAVARMLVREEQQRQARRRSRATNRKRHA